MPGSYCIQQILENITCYHFIIPFEKVVASTLPCRDIELEQKGRLAAGPDYAGGCKSTLLVLPIVSFPPSSHSRRELIWEYCLESGTLWKVVQPGPETTSEGFPGAPYVRHAAEDPRATGGHMGGPTDPSATV